MIPLTKGFLSPPVRKTPPAWYLAGFLPQCEPSWVFVYSFRKQRTEQRIENIPVIGWFRNTPTIGVLTHKASLVIDLPRHSFSRNLTFLPYVKDKNRNNLKTGYFLLMSFRIRLCISYIHLKFARYKWYIYIYIYRYVFFTNCFLLYSKCLINKS